MDLIKDFEQLTLPHAAEFIDKKRMSERIKAANFRFSLIYQYTDESRPKKVHFNDTITKIENG